MFDKNKNKIAIFQNTVAFQFIIDKFKVSEEMFRDYQRINSNHQTTPHCSRLKKNHINTQITLS